MFAIGLSRTILPALALAIGTGVVFAQPYESEPGDSALPPAFRYAPAVVPGAASKPVARPDTMWWIHGGVAVQLAGTFSDWATSWKQPEGNGMLAESAGRYAGRFYRTATAVKFGLAGGITVASYIVAWKLPKARRFVGMFNMTMGGAFAAEAVRNAIVNPYYKP